MCADGNLHGDGGTENDFSPHCTFIFSVLSLDASSRDPDDGTDFLGPLATFFLRGSYLLIYLFYTCTKHKSQPLSSALTALMWSLRMGNKMYRDSRQEPGCHCSRHQQTSTCRGCSQWLRGKSANDMVVSKKRQHLNT